MSDEPFHFGFDTVEIPFIWIPDDYEGPRPGYPWFEAGRLTLSAAQLAAWPPCRLAAWGVADGWQPGAEGARQSVDEAAPGSHSPGADPSLQADQPGHEGGAGARESGVRASNRARQYFDQPRGAIDALVRALNSMSDPAATLRILGGAAGAGSVAAPTSRKLPLALVGSDNLDSQSVPLDHLDPNHPTSGIDKNSGSGFQTSGASFGDGAEVVLPNGSRVPDKHSATSYLISPVPDLSPVAAAGRLTGDMFFAVLASPEASGSALPALMASMLANVGQGGVFDYQTRGNHITGFT